MIAKNIGVRTLPVTPWKGLWIVDDFLPNDDAENVSAVLNGVPPSEWDWMIKPVDADGSTGRLQNTAANQGAIELATMTEEGTKERGGFSYRYLRLSHSMECKCTACLFMELFNSKPVRARVIALTGRPIRETFGVMCTWYATGCYVSPHRDSKNGTLAFVYQLAKNWRVELGGCLHLMETDWSSVREVLVPTFNRMVLFDISDPDVRPHYVSQVVSGSISRRFAFSGWFA